MYLQYECKEPVSLYPALQWWNQPKIGAEWLFGGTGVGASNHFEAGGFIRSREEFAWPNIVCGDEVIFSEVSPRPHDTGMVTLISQDLSEFALHVRAFLGLPVGGIRQYGPAASAVILPQLTSQNVTFDNVQNAVGADLQISLGYLAPHSATIYQHWYR